jgi:hypothetical protein
MFFEKSDASISALVGSLVWPSHVQLLASADGVIDLGEQRHVVGGPTA